MSKANFTYFYTNPPFWAGEEPNWAELELRPDFEEYFSEIVSSHSKDGIIVRVARDGMVEISHEKLEGQVKGENEPADFEHGAKLWNEYLKLCNIYTLILDGVTVREKKSAQFEFREITSTDAQRTTYEENNQTSAGIPPNSVVGHYFMQRFRSTHRPGLPLRASFGLTSRWPLPLTILQSTFELFIAVCASPSLSESIYSLSKAISEFKKTNYRLTIVLSWFIVEAILKDTYSTYLTNLRDSSSRINADRRKFLEGRDFTAGVMSNILEIAEVIDISVLKRIDKLRQLRNDVAHSLNRRNIDMLEALESLQLAIELILKDTTLEMSLNLSLSMRSL